MGGGTGEERDSRRLLGQTGSQAWRRGGYVTLLFVIFAYRQWRLLLHRLDTPEGYHDLLKDPQRSRRSRGRVDRVFFYRLAYILKVVVPSWHSQESGLLFLLSLSLVIRTYMSIYIASVNGKVVKAIVDRNFRLFLARIGELGLYSLPASFVNSFIEAAGRLLALRFRTRLTDWLVGRYLSKFNFYQMSNLDSRVDLPDQRLCQDVEKWSNCLAALYSNLTKPILDIVLFSQKLAKSVGAQGPLAVIGWYLASGLIIKFVSPPFGRLTAREQRLEGAYRSAHSNIVTHAEEIAFYKGNQFELSQLQEKYRRLASHAVRITRKRLVMGSFDSLLVKYGAVIVGYSVVGLPVFGPGSEQYLKEGADGDGEVDAAKITQDYVSNSSLLINLAKAIGRVVVSYKEMQLLAGYTHLVFETADALRDVDEGRIVRGHGVNARPAFTLARQEPDSHSVAGQKSGGDPSQETEGDRTGRMQIQRDMSALSLCSEAGIIDLDFDALEEGRGGEVESSLQSLEFENAWLVSPGGETLVKGLSFKVTPGMNVFVLGPNGSGKSSLFRILGELWPLQQGVIRKPAGSSVFYLPQRPYLTDGSLRAQILYPQSETEFWQRGGDDAELEELMAGVRLSYLIRRFEDGWDEENDWADILSGGEQQRIAIARLCYHRPLFALCDECTSAVSIDVEGLLYEFIRQRGITVISISHRMNLLKYHTHILRFDGQGGWSFEMLQPAGGEGGRDPLPSLYGGSRPGAGPGDGIPPVPFPPSVAGPPAGETLWGERDQPQGASGGMPGLHVQSRVQLPPLRGGTLKQTFPGPSWATSTTVPRSPNAFLVDRLNSLQGPPGGQTSLGGGGRTGRPAGTGGWAAVDTPARTGTVTFGGLPAGAAGGLSVHSGPSLHTAASETHSVPVHPLHPFGGGAWNSWSMSGMRGEVPRRGSQGHAIPSSDGPVEGLSDRAVTVAVSLTPDDHTNGAISQRSPELSSPPAAPHPESGQVSGDGLSRFDPHAGSSFASSSPPRGGAGGEGEASSGNGTSGHQPPNGLAPHGTDQTTADRQRTPPPRLLQAQSNAHGGSVLGDGRPRTPSKLLPR